MRRPVIATTVSAIAIFTAGLVAAQLGGVTASLAASKPLVVTNVGYASRLVGISMAYHNRFGHSDRAKSVNSPANTVLYGGISHGSAALRVTSTMRSGGAGVTEVCPRGPPGTLR
jgi:fatty-acid desaturase